MHIKTTKRTGLLLSLIAMSGVSFGMDFNLSNLKITLSNNQKKLAAVAVPLAIAGGTYLYSQYGPPLSIPSFSYETKCSVATILSMPVVHSFLDRVTSSEDKLKLYYTALQQFEKSKFNKQKNQSKINNILNTKDKAEASDKLTDFIHAEFGEHPHVAAEKHLLDLKDIIEKGRQALKANNPIEDSREAKGLDEKKEQLKTLIRILRNSKQHQESKTAYDKQQRTDLKKEQWTFTSKIGTFVPMFIQPVSALCMVLLNMLFTKLGIE